MYAAAYISLGTLANMGQRIRADKIFVTAHSFMHSFSKRQ